jgi:hypothetical protein
MQEQADPREDTYKQLYLACHDYHFGKITFLEMLRLYCNYRRSTIRHRRKSRER